MKGAGLFSVRWIGQPVVDNTNDRSAKLRRNGTCLLLCNLTVTLALEHPVFHILIAPIVNVADDFGEFGAGIHGLEPERVESPDLVRRLDAESIVLIQVPVNCLLPGQVFSGLLQVSEPGFTNPAQDKGKQAVL